MEEKINRQVHKIEVEQVAAIQEKLTDQKKWILYGFALGLKAENPIASLTLPPTTGTKAAV